MSRQFDVHRNILADGLPGPPSLVNLQSDHLNPGPAVAVAPRWPVTARYAPHPVSIRLGFLKRDYWLVLTDMAYTRMSALGGVAGNIAVERDRIVRGLDLLFTGV